MKRNWRHRRPIFSSPLPPQVKNPKIKWKIWPILWGAFKRASFIIGALVILSSVVGAIAAQRIMEEDVVSVMPEEIVLFLKLDEGFHEIADAGDFVDPFAPPKLTLRELINTLDDAKDDERVKGLVARLDGGFYSITQVQEFRQALDRFKEAGKFSYVYSPSYADVSGLSGYYLASAFDEIWMQPMGVVAIPGLRVEIPFFRGALDKIGIEPQFFKRKEYKSAYESMTNTNISPENQEMMNDVIGFAQQVLIDDISKDRKINKDALEAMVDKGVFTSDKAKAASLVDRIGYGDELVNVIKERVKGSVEVDDSFFVGLSSYDPNSFADMSAHKFTPEFMAKQLKSSKPRVALIYVVGAIMRSSVTTGDMGVFLNQGIASANEIASAIWDAIEDPTIQTIVLRVDSPGGSPVAAETILHAVQKAKEEGKTVVVSMGTAAASGGYWVATHADKIFAMPTTLTGSIGVVGGKFSVAKLWQDLGINWEEISFGENAGMWSLNEPFSPSQQVQIETLLDHVYDSFVERVADGRGMSVAEVDEIAKGRVWTGVQAKDIGLVDELGTLDDALLYTAQTIGVESKDDLEIVLLPKPKTPIEKLFELLSEQVMIYETVKFQATVINAIKPAISSLYSSIFSMTNAVYEPLKL